MNLASLSPKDVRTITNEALLMQFSEHPNVMRVVGVCLPKGLLVMELALCSLSEYLYPITVQGEAATAQKAKLAPVNTLLKKLEVKWKLEVIQQLCDALQYLHRFHIMHRDIKSPNVMLFHDIYANKVIAKIGDFGLALAVDLITRTAQGTMMNTAIFQSALGTYNYMAPELFERQPGEKVAYSESSDVYSLGILINEIMSGAMPWGGGAREVDFMSWVVNKSMRPDVWIMSSSPTAAEKQLFAIVGRSDSAHPSCLHQSPSHRPTASEVCKAAYGSAPSLTAPTPPSSTKKGNVSTEKKVSTTTLQEGEIEVLIDDTIPITDADRPVIEAFAGELFIRLWHISESNAKRYAESLFQRNVANCGRFEQQLQSRSKLAPNGAVSWLQSQGFHEYDIDTVISNIAILQQVSNLFGGYNYKYKEVQGKQGVAVLDRWTQSYVPNVSVPRIRLQWAQLLWDNNITTVDRLLKYGDELDFLKRIGISNMDAQDIHRSIRNTHEKEEEDAKAKIARKEAYAELFAKKVCLNCCLCCIPMCITNFFYPTEKASIRNKWKGSSQFFQCEDCCSMIARPQIVDLCLCGRVTWARRFNNDFCDNTICFTTCWPVLFPIGVCGCVYVNAVKCLDCDSYYNG